MAWASQKRVHEEEEDKNYYHNLCNYSIEKCEFCDMVFSSRFASIIHNSSHIIIPLLKQKVHRCKKCLFCFTSKAELRTHKEIKHNKKKHEVEVRNFTQNGSADNSKESLKPITIKLKPTEIPKTSKIESPKIAAISINNFDNLNSTETKDTAKSSKRKTSESSKNNSPKKSKKDLVQDIIENSVKNKPLVQIDDGLKFTSTFKNKTILGSIPNRNRNVMTYIYNEIPDTVNGIPGTSNRIPDTSNAILPDLPNVPTKRNSSVIFMQRETSPISIHSDFSDIPDFSSDTPELRNVLKNSTLNGELKVLTVSDDDSDVPFQKVPQSNGIKNETKKIFTPMETKKKMSNGKSNDLSLTKEKSKNLPSTKETSNDLSLTKIKSLTKKKFVDMLSSPVQLSNLRSKIQFEDDIVDLSPLDKELKDLSFAFQSVHHDVLCEPCLSECRRCHMVFSNRMELYFHEKVHMKFKPLNRNQYYHCYICKKYFAGNHWSRKKHFTNLHPNVEIKKTHPHLCKICNANLEFGIKKMHFKFYHPHLICQNCEKTFATLSAVTSHSCQKVTADQKSGDQKVMGDQSTDVIQSCELCFSFTRNKQNFKYEIIGEKSEIGKRQKCFYCNKEYFDVKLVKRYNLTDRKYIKKEVKTEDSNKARLAKLQKRLKAIKVSNKF